MQKNTPQIPPASEVQISAFKSATDQQPRPLTLQRFFDAVSGRCRCAAQHSVLRLRGIDKAAQPEAYAAAKRQLPAFTLSCKCGASRTDHPEGNNGALCIDIDAADNPAYTDWPAVRDAVGLLPYVYFAALSASGRGVFAVLAVNPAIPHAQTYAAALAFFAERYGLILDRACKDVARLRFLSYDPQASEKPPTAIFSPPAVQKYLPKPKTRPAAQQRPYFGHGEFDRIRAAAYVWHRRGIALEDYGDWLKAAAALQQCPDGAYLFDLVSSHSPNYEGSESTSRKFAQAQLPQITPASFIYLCRQYGITDAEISAEAQAQRVKSLFPNNQN